MTIPLTGNVLHFLYPRFIVLVLLSLLSTVCRAELELDFSHERGYYSQSFQLTITPSDPSATIRYTTNGSKPGFNAGAIYSGPLSVSNITNLKVFAYTASESTKVIAHSYIFMSSAIAQGDSYIVNSGTYAGLMQSSFEALPVISLSSNNINHGNFAITTETEVSAELFFPDQSRKGFMINCGIQTWGGSPTNPKKHYRLEFKSIYGDGKLKYDIFEQDNYDQTEYGVKPTAKFDKLLLRSGSQDGLNAEYGNEVLAQYVRNRVQFDKQMEMGYPAPHGRFVHVFINGQYNGMYHLMERPDEAFFESYYGYEKDDFEIYKSGGYWNGPLGLFDALPNYVNNLTSQSAIDNANQYIDLDQTAGFLTLMCYGGGFDWTSTHNCMGGGHVTPGVVPYKFLLWDIDFTLGNGGRWHPSYGGDPNFFRVPYQQDGQVPDELDQQLEFKYMMADKMDCACFDDGILTASKMDDAYMHRIDQVRIALIAESSIWGNYPFSFGSNHISKSYWDVFDEFDTETNRVRNNYIPVRTNNMINYWKNEGIYPTTQSVQFSIDGGIVPQGQVLTLTNPGGTGTIYYTLDGTDPREVNGYIRSTAIQYTGPITLPNGVKTVKARVRNTNYGRTTINRWSAMCPKTFYVDQDYSSIVINEILYHPDSLCASNGNDSTEIDFIEIHNKGNKTVNLQGCFFNSGIEFEFTESATIAPGGYLVLAENEQEFFLAYFTFPFGQYKGGLSNDGEFLSLLNPEDGVIDSLKYNDKNPWDEEPDGNGPSLELLSPDFDNGDPLNWFRSDNNCGTPGAANSRVCSSTALPIVINEINYNSDNLNFDPGDWIEFHNPNSTPVNLQGWQLFDNNNEFTFPTNTVIQPGEFLVLVENTNMFSSSFPEVSNYIGEFTYAFSNKGERISLFNPDKCLSDYVIYNDRIPWDTMPDGNGPTLSLINPGLDNALPSSWESSGNINAPHGTPGRANQPCPVFNVEIPDSTCIDVADLFIVSILPDSRIEWSFPNATPATSTSGSVSVTFNSTGPQTVQLITYYYDCIDTIDIPIDVLQCNSPPSTLPDIYTIDEDNPLAGNVLTNDSEPDGEPMTASMKTNVSNGILILYNNGDFTYTPNADYFGMDGFTYEVCDNATPVMCAIDTVTIKIISINDAPDTKGDLFVGNEDNIVSGNVLTNDSDIEGNTLSATLGNMPSNGSIVLNNDGSFDYTPNLNFFGSDFFTYEVCDDGSPSECITENVTISISPVNDPPLTSPDALSLNEDSAGGGGNVLSNDTEVENQPISVTLATNVSNGTLTFNPDGSYSYVPNANFNGTDQFTYEACDNASPVLCATETVTITVLSINDAPVTLQDQFYTNEDLALNENVLTNDSDIDGNALTATVSSNVTNGTLVLQTNGSFTYTPNLNYFGNDSFEYQVCDDGTPSICLTETVILLINSVNDAPVTQADSYSLDEDTQVSGNVLTNDSEVENQPISVTLSTNVSNGTLTFNPDGSFNYVPNANYNGTDQFTYEACDNDSPIMCASETVTITVNPINDAPTTVLDNFAGNEDTPLNGNVVSNDSDIDGHTLTTSIFNSPANGSLSMQTNGQFTYTPNLNYYGIDTFRYEVCDNGSPIICVTETVVLTISNVNDAPVAVADSYSIDEDNTINDDVVTNDSDADNDPLTATIVSNVSFGTLTLNPDGTFVYVPNANYYGVDGFSYQICDNGAICDTEIVSITIASVNDAPIALNDSISVDQDVQVAGDVSTNDSDVETAQLNYSLVNFSQNGSVLFNFDGSFYYTPFAGYYGPDSFTYQACDDDTPTICDTATVYIDVVPECAILDIAVNLEGPYDLQTGLMSTTLNTVRAILPGMSGNPVAGQPYDVAPWYYLGNEGLGWTDADYTPTMVDWVLVSFRTNETKSSEVFRIAGLLNEDGTLEFPETCINVSELSGSYYIVIEHRNHMAVMSPVKVSLVNRTLTWDFRVADSYMVGGNGSKELTAGVWAMFAGDCNQIDDPVQSDINGQDKASWLLDNGKFGVYLTSDIDMNGDVTGGDKAAWLLNNGVFGSVKK